MSDTDYEAVMTAAADHALALGETVVVPWEGTEMVVIPDVVAAEGEANGLPPLPPTIRLVRLDGRSVRMFRLPTAAERTAS